MVLYRAEFQGKEKVRLNEHLWVTVKNIKTEPELSSAVGAVFINSMTNHQS